jgi:hypothetical protein
MAADDPPALHGEEIHCIGLDVAIDLLSVSCQRFPTSLADKDVMPNVEMPLDGVFIKMPVDR